MDSFSDDDDFDWGNPRQPAANKHGVAAGAVCRNGDDDEGSLLPIAKKERKR